MMAFVSCDAFGDQQREQGGWGWGRAQYGAWGQRGQGRVRELGKEAPVGKEGGRGEATAIAESKQDVSGCSNAAVACCKT